MAFTHSPSDQKVRGQRGIALVLAVSLVLQISIAPVLLLAPRAARADELPADTTPPTVQVVSPVDGAVVSGSATIEVTAADNVGVTEVQLLVDDVAHLAPDLEAPYLIEWNTLGIADGVHTVSAEARDAAGNVTLATAISVTVDNLPDTTAPSVSLANPPAGTVLALDVTLSAKLEDDTGIAGVQYFLDDLPIGPVLTESPYSLEWDSTTVPNGPHRLAVEAWDAAGNRTRSDDVAITCNNADVNNENEAEIRNNVSSNANTGGNSAVGNYDPVTNTGGVPTPSLITSGDATAGVALSTQVNTNITDLATGSGTDVSVTNDSTADLINNVATTATTGLNVTNNNRFSEMNSGDANIFTTVLNAVNTSVVGSNFATVANDIFDLFVGDIDFVSAIMSLFTHGLGAGNLEVHNTSTGSISNNVTVDASTGSNTANDNRQSHIATGDINVATNVVNLLNTNIVGANWLFSTINVFGEFVGDIILPGQGVLESLFGTPTTQLTVENDNTAGVVNTVAVNADTGNNTSIDNRDALIQTGDVQAQTRSISTINTNIINANFFSFMPNILGNWIGGEMNPWGGSLLDADVNTDHESSLGVDINNTARINNTVTVNASTGLNSTNNNRYSSIDTGDIRVATNLVNVANTNIIGSNWFMGNLNLFGTWRGNIQYSFPDLALGTLAPAVVDPGAEVTYQLTFSNLGRAPGQSVRLRDTLPPTATFVSATDGGTHANGVVTWNLGLVGSRSEPRTVSFVVRFPADVPVGDTPLLNAAQISTVTPEPETANNAVQHTTVVHRDPPPAPALNITKSSDASGTKLPGQPVNFHLAVTNTGNVALTNLVVSDRMPGANGTMLYQRDFPLDRLEPGVTMDITYQMTISQGTGAGTYTNTAQATGQFNGTAVQSGTATSAVRVGVVQASTPSPTPAPAPAAPAQSVPPTVTKKIGSLTVTQTLLKPRKSYKAGDSLSFRLTVTNTGTKDLRGVVLSEQFINGKKRTVQWALGTIKRGVGLALTYVLRLASDIRPGTVISRVFATGKATDGQKVTSKNTDLKFKVTKAPAKVAKKTPTKTTNTAGVRKKLSGRIDRTANGGMAFFDSRNRPISAWQYAKNNSLSMVDMLRASRDPVDRAFVHAYDSGMKLVGKKNKQGVVIRSEDVVRELRAAAKFRVLYGGAFTTVAGR